MDEDKIVRDYQQLLDRARKSKDLQDDLALLEVKQSLIEGAGKGLFVKQDLSKGDFIGVYNGKVLWPYTIDPVDREKCTYMLEIPSRYNRRKGKLVIDAIDEDSCLTRYINHSSKTRHINCKVVMFGEAVDYKVPVFILTRDVKAGTELLFDYGPQYHWAKGEEKRTSSGGGTTREAKGS